MSEALKSLLFEIRQHAAFQELLNSPSLQPVPMPRYKKGETLEDLGARTAFASGQHVQHDKLMVLLTGQPASQESNS